MDDLFRNLGLFAGLLVYLVFVVPFLLLGLAIPYAILHVRDSRSLERDPQLGIKTVLYFFFSVAILLALTGLTVIAVDAVKDQQPPAFRPPTNPFQKPGAFPVQPPVASREWYNDTKRQGSALIFAGLVFGMVQFVLLKTVTNDGRWPIVRRVFGGWRLAISGLIFLALFTLLVLILFRENLQPESLKEPLAALCVWTPAALVDLVLLRVRSPRRAIVVEPMRERLARGEVEE